jgi:hypothetical protein
MTQASTSLGPICAWYRAQCDGEWEHAHGVTIGTLDNPGWRVTIDLGGTRWANAIVPNIMEERSEVDWVQSEVVAGRFDGHGGAGNLEELLERFLAVVEGETHS